MKILNDINKVKTIIESKGGVYNDRKTWVLIDEIMGIVRLGNELKGCAVLLNAPYQSINSIYLHDDGNIYISNCSIGGAFIGDLNKMNIEKYNQSMIYDGSKIVDIVKF